MRMKITSIIALALIASLTALPAYAKKDKGQGRHDQLPPGLQKQADRGKPLPPGWQKKLAKGEVMDADVYRQSHIEVPVDSHGLITVRVEGKLVKLYEATREVVEVLE